MATEIDTYMKLTTTTVEGKIRGEPITWEITVMGPNATSILINLLPDSEEFELGKFIRDNYLTLAKDVVYPSILKPKIPLDRLTINDVILIFPILYEMSFPAGDAEDDTETFREK